MKTYNNFNEMFNANCNTNKNLSVFNDYQNVEQFDDDINGYLAVAFKEWYDGLNAKQKSNFARFGDDWFYETEQDYKMQGTKTYKKMCDNIRNGGVDNLFANMQDNKNVISTIRDEFGVDITDEQELRQAYGENYKLAAVDCLKWCIEHYWDCYSIYLKENLEKAQKEYFSQFDYYRDYKYGDDE